MNDGKIIRDGAENVGMGCGGGHQKVRSNRVESAALPLTKCGTFIRKVPMFSMQNAALFNADFRSFLHAFLGKKNKGNGIAKGQFRLFYKLFAVCAMLFSGFCNAVFSPFRCLSPVAIMFPPEF